jgi:hypothetical protein
MKNPQQLCRLFIRAFVFALLVVVLSVPGFCQSGPPALPFSLLDGWVLDQPDWLDIYGGPPLGFTNLNTAPGWSLAGTALSVDTNCGAFLDLTVIDDFGDTNIFLDSGTILFWYQANWTSTADGGDGPTNWATMLSIGNWTSNAAQSAWTIAIDPDGTNLIFLAQSNGTEQIVLTAPIDFDAGDWHNIALTYSSTNCCLYLEGEPVTNTGPIAYLPTDSDCAEYGAFVGSEGSNGVFQARGQFQDLESDDGPFTADMIAEEYGDTAAVIVAAGGKPAWFSRRRYWASQWLGWRWRERRRKSGLSESRHELVADHFAAIQLGPHHAVQHSGRESVPPAVGHQFERPLDHQPVAPGHHEYRIGCAGAIGNHQCRVLHSQGGRSRNVEVEGLRRRPWRLFRAAFRQPRYRAGRNHLYSLQQHHQQCALCDQSFNRQCQMEQ